MARAHVVSADEPSGPYDWYVDSVNGSDLYSGKKPTKALRTIAALRAKPVQAFDKIGLARGSYWREMLYVYTVTWADGLPNGVEIYAYGSGNKPVLDGADVIPAASWTKTGGRTYVYQATVDTSFITADIGSMGNRIWEDFQPRGAALGRLTYVADVATCDATAGSWTGPQRPTGGSDTFYVHASDDSDPATNGKVYEWPARHWCVNGGLYQSDTTRVYVLDGVEGRRWSHHNGGIINSGTVRNCVADMGGTGPVDPSHSLWNNGLAEDCQAGSTISYGDDIPPTTARRLTLDCRWSTGATTPATGTAVYFHSSSESGAHPHQKKTYEDITITHAATAFGGGDALQVAIIRPVISDDSTEAFASLTYIHNRLDIVGGTWVRAGAASATSGVQLTNSTGAIFVRGVRWVKNLGNHLLLYTGATGALTVQGSSIGYVTGGSAGYRGAIGAGGSAVTMDHNLVIYSYQPWNFNTIALANVASNYNLFSNESTSAVEFKVGGTTYASFALWQAASRDVDSYREAITTTNMAAGIFAPTCAHSSLAGADAYGDSHLAGWIAEIP